MDKDATTELLGLLERVRVVPVLTITEVAQAVPMARALCAGGLPALEVTLRSKVALDAARLIMSEVPEATVGLGTLLSPGDVEDAVRIGARFIVSPGTTPDLLRVAAQSGLPFLPGVATVSEAMRAREAGFPVLKLFPAEAVGGTALLKSIAGPFAALRFCPTGGIDGRNLRSYLDLPNVVAVGGSWMAPASDIADGAWDRITERARDAFRLARLTEMSAG